MGKRTLRVSCSFDLSDPELHRCMMRLHDSKRRPQTGNTSSMLVVRKVNPQTPSRGALKSGRHCSIALLGLLQGPGEPRCGETQSTGRQSFSVSPSSLGNYFRHSSPGRLLYSLPTVYGGVLGERGCHSLDEELPQHCACSREPEAANSASLCHFPSWLQVASLAHRCADQGMRQSHLKHSQEPLSRTLGLSHRG